MIIVDSCAVEISLLIDKCENESGRRGYGFNFECTTHYPDYVQRRLRCIGSDMKGAGERLNS